ncbi:hypothetical protein J6590_029986 [Homalodisca vitripennis]|nr:hypothetical protein J6590_029986 [Homalodisca vitripennis]
MDKHHETVPFPLYRDSEPSETINVLEDGTDSNQLFAVVKESVHFDYNELRYSKSRNKESIDRHIKARVKDLQRKDDVQRASSDLSTLVTQPSRGDGEGGSSSALQWSGGGSKRQRVLLTVEDRLLN